MSGDQNHNERFNEAFDEFSSGVFDELVERHIKEKSGIFDSDVLNVPPNTLAVIENAQQEIRETLNKASQDLQAREDNRRLRQQSSLLELFLPVSANDGKTRDWNMGEQDQILGQRISTWKEKLVGDPRKVVPNFERAQTETKSRFKFAEKVITEEGGNLELVHVSMTSFTAPFVKNVVKQVFFNWGPWDDMHTFLWNNDLVQMLESLGDNLWYENFPNSDFAKKGSDGSPSTTLALFQWIIKMFLPPDVNFSMENVCPYLLLKEWTNKETRPPHREPDLFMPIARDTFFRWLSSPEESKTNSAMMIASNTIKAFLTEVMDNRWTNKYILLRLENSAFRKLSSRTATVQADSDFLMENPEKPHVFGIYMLCDLDEATGKNDILIEAIPAPSGLVKVVKEGLRGQSYRRIVGIAEASNNMRRRRARTGWISELSFGLIGLRNLILEEDLIPDDDIDDDSEGEENATPPTMGTTETPSVGSSLQQTLAGRKARRDSLASGNRSGPDKDDAMEIE